MAVAYTKVAQNTYESSVTGGVIPSANKKIEVVEWMKRLEPRETPLTSAIGFGKPINQDVFYWGQSYHPAVSGTIAEDLDNSETGIDLTTGQGSRLGVYDVIAITDYKADGTTLDHSTRELVWITSFSTDTATVTRGVGGTSAVSHTGTGSAPARWDLVGSALPQNQDFTLSPVTRGDQLYNYFQEFQGKVQASQMARNMPTWENPTDIFTADLETVGMRLKLALEQAIIYGGRQRGVVGTPTPSMMGGLDTFITTNVTNAAGAKLNAYSIEDELYRLYTNVGSNAADTFLMSPGTSRIFDTFLNPYREADFSTTSLDLTLSKIKFRFGTFDVIPSRWIPDGIIYGVNLKNISLHPFEGCNWQIQDLPSDGPYSEKGIYGSFSLCVKSEAAMFKLWNFETNMSQYPRGEYI